MEQWELRARERVRDTYAAYHHAGDRFRLDEFIGCFTEDGVLEIKGQPPMAGRSAILARLSTPPEAGAATAEAPQLRHFMTNLAFTDVTADRIESSAYFQVLTQHGLDHWGRYRDVLVPEADGQWRFQHRLVAVDAMTPGGWYATTT